ncbi:unnamed protein product (macronuclear) [Paramecium tetraurelia]|uniref:Trichohyalin n=1 Tax=Paramecium tetraurelia TaxID=5888 RepID=A0C2A1_PARTE|nr:uncharacterized protein GSPATT00034395001 [Paramecium tetraurelia]CAK64918.1 unnamed protein product [Paramecium tetraurelia]|eukprot:XP_001432315.1 hypothetical protein (macronuclear) [Paramecium tetraurelia strain d4-2]
MQQNENDSQHDDPQPLQEETKEQQQVENNMEVNPNQEQQNETDKQNEQFNITSQFPNHEQQEGNIEITILDTEQQGDAKETSNQKGEIINQEQAQNEQENIDQTKLNKQNSINNQNQDPSLSNNTTVQQDNSQQNNKVTQQDQQQSKEQKQQEKKGEENDQENQGQRKNQKKKTTKRRTTKVEIQENQEKNNPAQSNTNINEEKEKEEQEQIQQKIEEQKQIEELQRKQELEQQEQLQRQKQLVDKVYKDLIFPLKRSQNKNGKKLDSSFEIQSEKFTLEQVRCKSAKRYQRERKPRTRSAINQELLDFYNKINPQQHKDQSKMTPNTLQRLKKQQELEQMKKDCERLEEQQNQQQNAFSQPQKENKSKTQNKQRAQTQAKKKLEVVVRKRKKIKIRNGLRERMLIDKDKDSQLKALDFIRKMQQNRMAAEQKRQEQLEKITNKISSDIESLRQGSQIYKQEQQKQKRKQALEQITKQEQKRYEMMLEQQRNEKFVRELKEKSAVSSHYSVKKLALGYSPSLVTELENGQIQIEQIIDTNRKMNENQFLLKEEQKQRIKENKMKQQDYSKQVSLLHLPKVNNKKNYELLNEQLSTENKEPLPQIKQKHKKAWQIEQELMQKKHQNSEQLKE